MLRCKKLIVQIPAFNEEKAIGKVIQSIPRKIKGVKNIKIIVWDDGSSDQTAKIAKKAGADYIFSNTKNLGLGQTFARLLKKSLELGAEIIVNTDADNQYNQTEIPKLIQPIIDQQADLVTGDRQIGRLKHMAFLNKYGNLIGSFVLKLLTNQKIKDVSCGFRAYSRECAQNLMVISEHTYTHETIIQAAFKKMTIKEIPISFNKRTGGKSRLISNVFLHIGRAMITIIRAILMYRAFTVLVTLGFIIVMAGIAGIVRFLYFFSIGHGNGHIQSLIIASIFIGTGFNTIVMGIIADLITVNRKIIKGKFSKSSPK